MSEQIYSSHVRFRHALSWARVKAESRFFLYEFRRINLLLNTCHSLTHILTLCNIFDSLTWCVTSGLYSKIIQKVGGWKPSGSKSHIYLLWPSFEQVYSQNWLKHPKKLNYIKQSHSILISEESSQWVRPPFCFISQDPVSTSLTYNIFQFGFGFFHPK